MKRRIALTLMLQVPLSVLAQTASMPTMTAPPAPMEIHAPAAGVLTGGQPDAQAWKRLAAAGVTTVINLRPDGEMAGRDEAAEVAAVGMAYKQIPVAGAADITPANANTLWEEVLAARAKGTVLVHCASGNRVGALIALGAVQHGFSAEQALELGKASGLTSAEPRVRELLKLPAQGQ